MPHATTLHSATISTFEELALLLADPDAAPPPGQPLAGGVCLEFSGPLSGALVLHVTGDVLDALAANMLGCGAAPSEALRRDALGEVANVLCGTLLPGIAGKRAEFRLAPPRWIAADAATPPTDGDDWATTVCVVLEGGRAEATLRLAEAGRPTGGEGT